MGISRLTGKLFIIGVFAIAMAFLESAVVIYLRELYYPGGFEFPLKLMDSTLALTEMLREAATIVMILSIGFLLGRRPVEVFAVFLLAFGTWDIFYYFFLKWLIHWPSSFLTWDILFLIPVLWVGPVIGPVVNSVLMIIIGFLILLYSHRNLPPNLSRWEWVLLIGGALLVFLSYTEEFTQFLLVNLSPADIFTSGNRRELIRLSTTFIPQRFHYWLYVSGTLLHVMVIALYVLRMQKMHGRILIRNS